MAGYLPASEADLFVNRPASVQPNTFPRGALLGAEKVIYETRPSFFGLHPWLIYGSMPFVLLGLAVLGVALSQSLVLGLTVLYFPVITLLPLLYAIASWSRSSYAITDQRVLARHGSDFDSIPYDRVQGIQLKQNTSNVVFSVGPAPGAPGTVPAAIVWEAVPMAPAVVAFLQSAVAFYRIQGRQTELRDDLTIASMSHTVVCQYCGGLIDVSKLSGADPRCPRCSAPFDLSTLPS